MHPKSDCSEFIAGCSVRLMVCHTQVNILRSGTKTVAEQGLTILHSSTHCLECVVLCLVLVFYVFLSILSGFAIISLWKRAGCIKMIFNGSVFLTYSLHILHMSLFKHADVQWSKMFG